MATAGLSLAKAKATVVAADETSRIANMEVRPIACWSTCTCTCDMFANMKIYLVVCSLQKMLAVLYEKLHSGENQFGVKPTSKGGLTKKRTGGRDALVVRPVRPPTRMSFMFANMH